MKHEHSLYCRYAFTLTTRQTKTCREKQTSVYVFFLLYVQYNRGILALKQLFHLRVEQRREFLLAFRWQWNIQTVSYHGQ